MEALSATGLRSVRYAKEIPNVASIVANDIEADAVKLIAQNIQDNLGQDPKIVANHADAM